MQERSISPCPALHLFGLDEFLQPSDCGVERGPGGAGSLLQGPARGASARGWGEQKRVCSECALVEVHFNQSTGEKRCATHANNEHRKGLKTQRVTHIFKISFSNSVTPRVFARISPRS